jgi:hypothetical protein
LEAHDAFGIPLFNRPGAARRSIGKFATRQNVGSGQHVLSNDHAPGTLRRSEFSDRAETIFKTRNVLLEKSNQLWHLIRAPGELGCNRVGFQTALKIERSKTGADQRQ